MTLIEALKSGRPFRRSEWERWCNGYDDEVDQFSLFFEGLQKKLFGMLSTEDILADDWETKPAEVTITREKLAAVWYSVMGNWSRADQFELLAKELG